jgi:CHASE3 domain sensor protein
LPNAVFSGINQLDNIRATAILAINFFSRTLAFSLPSSSSRIFQRPFRAPGRTVGTTPYNAQPSGLRSLERNVLFGFGAAAMVLFLIGLLSYLSVARFRNDARLVDHTHQVLNSLSKLLSNLAAAESSQRGFVISGKEEHIQEYDAAVQQIEQQLSHLRELTRDNTAQQVRLDILVPLVGERLSLMKSRLELARTAGLAAAQASITAEQGKSVREKIRGTVAAMEEEEDRLLLEREKRAQTSSLLTIGAVVSGAVLALGLLVAALSIVRQWIPRECSNGDCSI